MNGVRPSSNAAGSMSDRVAQSVEQLIARGWVSDTRQYDAWDPPEGFKASFGGHVLYLPDGPTLWVPHRRAEALLEVVWAVGQAGAGDAYEQVLALNAPPAMVRAFDAGQVQYLSWSSNRDGDNGPSLADERELARVFEWSRVLDWPLLSAWLDENFAESQA